MHQVAADALVQQQAVCGHLDAHDEAPETLVDKVGALARVAHPEVRVELRQLRADVRTLLPGPEARAPRAATPVAAGSSPVFS